MDLDEARRVVGAPTGLLGVDRVVGHQRPDEKLGRELLVAHEAKLLAAAPSEHGVRHVLEAATTGFLDAEAASAALTPAGSTGIHGVVRLWATPPRQNVPGGQGCGLCIVGSAGSSVSVPSPQK